ncbi:MAG TPA: hypothetical protein VGD02_07645 [Gemmatimonadaceae bacterium]|jgi:hypothetical protein
MTRVHVLSAIAIVLVGVLLVVSLSSMADGRRMGGAEAAIAIAKAQRDSALAHEAAAEAREKVWRDSAARAHNAGARSGAEFHKRYTEIQTEPPVVLTDTAAVLEALRVRDSALAVAAQAIADRDRELAARDSADKARDTADAAREERYRALEKINGEMKRLVPSRTSKVVTASKWVLIGFAIGTVANR